MHVHTRSKPNLNPIFGMLYIIHSKRLNNVINKDFFFLKLIFCHFQWRPEMIFKLVSPISLTKASPTNSLRCRNELDGTWFSQTVSAIIQMDSALSIIPENFTLHLSLEFSTKRGRQENKTQKVVLLPTGSEFWKE